MKKAGKRFMAVLCAVALVVSCSVAAFAQTNSGWNRIEQENTNALKALRYYSCPGGGKHHMTGRGTGFAYRGAYPSNDLVIYGFCAQCDKCGDFIISENSPFWADTSHLGTYAYGNANYRLSNNGTVFYTNDFYYNSSLAEDTFFRSFEWYAFG